MTIEEFRNFGWKAGMVIKHKRGIEEIDAVFFNHRTVVGDNCTILYHDIISAVLNPDGTVAWRKE
jgi:hypothetical protein